MPLQTQLLFSPSSARVWGVWRVGRGGAGGVDGKWGGVPHKPKWTVQKAIGVSCRWDRRKAPTLHPVIMSGEPVLTNRLPLSSHLHLSVSRYQVDM